MEKSFDCRAGVATLAWNVETADLDNDGIVEIITVGCMETENLLDCDPDMRIWSLMKDPGAFSDPILMMLGLGSIGGAVIIFLLVKRRVKKSW